MNGPVIPREQAFAAARRELDLARARRDREYAAGCLSPEQTAVYERLLAKYRPQYRAAA